jgi:apolipoprotein D and lipocalin family protein
LPVVEHVTLERYAGRWYEVARLPNRFERECAGDISAAYALLPDGKVSVLNQCRKPDGRRMSASGVAKSADGSSTARLKVRFAPSWLGFLPFVWGDYWIIELASDYSWSLVGSPDRKYLWILSRQSTLDQAQISRLLERARTLGFATGNVIRVNNAMQENPSSVPAP